MRRILLLALAAFIAVVGIGAGLSYALLGLAAASPFCVGWEMISCILVTLPLSGMVAMAGGVFVAWYLLKKQNSPHPLATPILAIVNSFILVIVWYFTDIMQFYLVFGLIVALSLIFFERYLNHGTGDFGSKVLRSIAGIGILTIIGYFVRHFMIW
jgi:hypothetical protein